MRRLNEVGKSWRNYLYANYDGVFNEVEDFVLRVGIINDSMEELLDTMLEDEPDNQLVKECKEEITFQRESLRNIAKEFADYHNNVLEHKIEIFQDVILNEFCKREIDNYYYQIAKERESLGGRAHKIWDRLNDNYGDGLRYIHDDLCKMILDEWEDK